MREGWFVLAARSISETTQIRYLLGLSSPAEREHIESEYFENEDAFQEMLTAEDDLIDAYARGELAGEERRRFEKSFVSSLGGRERVQFAREFAGAVSTTRSVGTKPRSTLLDILKSFQSPYLSRTATFAVVIVFLAVLAWVVVDRRRMSNELHELSAESAELSKRTAALQQSERTRTGEMATQLADLRTQSDTRGRRERGTAATQRSRELPEIKNGREITTSKPEQAGKPINTQDASLGKAFETRITATPILGRKFENQTATLLPRVTTISGTAIDPQGRFVNGANVTLINSARNVTKTQITDENGAYVFTAVPPGIYRLEVEAEYFKKVVVSEVLAQIDTPTTFDVQLEVGNVTDTVSVIAGRDAPITVSDATIGNTFSSRRITELPLNANNVVGLLSLQPGVTRSGYVNGGRSDQANTTLDGVDANLRIPSSVSWIRFQIGLKPAAIHEDYRVTLKTLDGRPITSVDWSEPLTPNQTVIDTPAILTAGLYSNDCVLALMGKEPDGSFVKIAEYSFKVIKY